MSIATELTRLQTAKSNIKSAIENKGVAVPSNATLSTYNTYIAQISGGGGGGGNTGIITSKQASEITASGSFMPRAYITGVTIPSGFTSIGSYAFERFTAMTSVSIPNTVTSIGNSAFYECTGLTSITIPDSVTTIGTSCFYYSQNITTVEIGSGITSIGQSAFYQILNFTTCIIHATTPPTLGSNVFDLNLPQTWYIYVPDANVEDYKEATDWVQYAARIKGISEL